MTADTNLPDRVCALQSDISGLLQQVCMSFDVGFVLQIELQAVVLIRN